MVTYRFIVDFDAEAGVWYVCDSNLPGLQTEAESLDILIQKLRVMVPDLLDAIDARDGGDDGKGEIPLEVVLHVNSQARAAAA